MKQFTNGFIGNRVLKLNVGFLLTSGPGHIHETEFDVPALRVAEDVDLRYLRGPLRLSRTKEGILVQGQLKAGVTDECYRCLDPVEHELTLDLEELYAYPNPHNAEFSLNDDGILDLSPLIRAEALLADAGGALCREDCQGLCPDCGANRNREVCSCADDVIDPRLAKLKQLLDR